MSQTVDSDNGTSSTGDTVGKQRKIQSTAQNSSLTAATHAKWESETGRGNVELGYDRQKCCNQCWSSKWILC